MRTLVLGPAGCGKTTDLLSRADDFLAAGVPPERIAYLSFTRAAAQEAINRAVAKFGLARDRFPYWRTVHSLTFHELGARTTNIMQTKDYRELGDATKLRFTGDYSRIAVDGAVALGDGDGDAIKFVEEQARIRMRPLDDVVREIAPQIPRVKLSRYIETLAAFKAENDLMDFTDLLTEYADHGTPLPVDVFILDEAQDLSRLQWQVAFRAMQNATEVIIAGDDDQAIHAWCGADVDTFLNLDVDRRIVLDKTYRLPKCVHALSDRIVHRIRHRYAKEWRSEKDTGRVQHVANVDMLDASEGDWLFLVRNTRYVAHFEDYARHHGLHYAVRGRENPAIAHLKRIRLWEDMRKGTRVTLKEARAVYAMMEVGAQVARGFKALPGPDSAGVTIDDLEREHGLLTRAPWYDAMPGIGQANIAYLRKLLRRGEKIGGPPRVRIDTIHGVKGSEATNVVLLPDMTYPTYQEYARRPDNEHRVFYVGVSRAKENLYLLNPRSIRHYKP